MGGTFERVLLEEGLNSGRSVERASRWALLRDTCNAVRASSEGRSCNFAIRIQLWHNSTACFNGCPELQNCRTGPGFAVRY